MTSIAASEAAAAPPRRQATERPRLGAGFRVSFALPLVLPAALAGYGVVAMTALLAGQFSAAVVLPVGLLVAAASGLVALRAGIAESKGWDGGGRLADVVALLGSVAWFGGNLPFGSQRINLFRDPATYANTAVYLVHHSALPIPAHTAVFGGPHPAVALNFATTGFAPLANPDQLQAQGAHLLPAVLASAGWIGGDRALFEGNLLIGAVALLALYALGRRVISAWWALGATTVLAATLPMLEVSRATYTEPLAMLFVWGGLALLVAAHRTGKLWHFAVAGLTFGATAMTRIDGLLTLLAVFGYAAVVLGGAILRRQGRPSRELAAFLAPVALDAVLALRDLQSLAAKYYHDLGSEVRQIRLAALGLLVAAAFVVALVAVGSRRPKRVSTSAGAHPGGPNRWVPLAYLGGGLMAFAMIFLGVRRLWYAGHQNPPLTYIEFLQKAGRLKVDGTRIYSELSVTWLVWYVGIVAIVVGVAGLSMVTFRVVRTLEPPLVLALATWIFAAVYLYDPKIYPDQVWGVRRLLPVVLPGLLLAGSALLAAVASRGAAGRVAAGLVAVAVGVQTAFAGHHLALTRQDTPQLAEAQALCRALPADAAVVVTSELSNTYLEPVRSFCDVPAAGLANAATSPGLAALRSAAQRAGKQLYAVSSVAGSLPGIPKAAQPYSSITWKTWNATLTSPPSHVGAPSRRLWVGRVDASGSVSEVTGNGPLN